MFAVTHVFTPLPAKKRFRAVLFNVSVETDRHVACDTFITAKRLPSARAWSCEKRDAAEDHDTGRQKDFAHTSSHQHSPVKLTTGETSSPKSRLSSAGGP